jgi:transposase-like protein
MPDRGGSVAHATVKRGVIPYRPPRADAGHRRTPRGRGRLDETSIPLTGAGRSRERAVETPGHTRDWRRTEHRDQAAAVRCRPPASRRHGGPAQRTRAGRAAHDAALKHAHEAPGTSLAIGPLTSLTPMGDPAHRGVTRVTRSRRGCTALAAAHDMRTGSERLHLLQTRPLVVEAADESLPAAEPVSALAASSPHGQGDLPLPDLRSKICDTTRDDPRRSAPGYCQLARMAWSISSSTKLR